MYHFMSGYTAKVAGTEMGITEPTTTFSACFGKAFLPLHPSKYADLLGDKLNDNDINVWLVNTGWTGGQYGTGERIKLKWTRSLITEALNGSLNKVQYETLPLFNLQIPTECKDVPSNILNPRNTWSDLNEYDEISKSLANKFIDNFKQFESNTNINIIEAGPKLD